MALERHKPILPAEVTSNPDILGGEFCVRGTRVPALTVIAYIVDGYEDWEIFTDYSSLPIDGIKAVRQWAAAQGIDLSVKKPKVAAE